MLAFLLQGQGLAEPVSQSDALKQARQYKAAGQCAAALPWFNKALEAALRDNDRSQQLTVLRLRGECYQYEGDFALAWLDLAYGRHLAPAEARFYEGLGWLAIFQGTYATAEAHLRQAQALAPDNAWVQLNLGWAHYLQGQLPQARSLWQPLWSQPRYHKALQREMQQLQDLGIPEDSFEALQAWLAN